MGAGHQKDQAMMRSLEFSALPPIFQSGEWDGNGVNDWLCLCIEASIKVPKIWGSESFRGGEHVEILGEWCTCPHVPCPTHLFELDVRLYPLSHPFIEN